MYVAIVYDNPRFVIYQFLGIFIIFFSFFQKNTTKLFTLHTSILSIYNEKIDKKNDV